MGHIALSARIHQFALVSRHVKILWGLAGLKWGGLSAAAIMSAPLRVYLLVQGLALVTTLAAIQATAVTSRIDRQYRAMLEAATRQQIPGADDAVVVPFPERGRRGISQS